jgi:hypothetical protein
MNHLEKYDTPGQGRSKDQYKHSLIIFTLAFIAICVLGSVLILIRFL